LHLAEKKTIKKEILMKIHYTQPKTKEIHIRCTKYL